MIFELFKSMSGSLLSSILYLLLSHILDHFTDVTISNIISLIISTIINFVLQSMIFVTERITRMHLLKYIIIAIIEIVINQYMLII